MADDGKLNVFIGWTGAAAHSLALKLAAYLEQTLTESAPWVSSRDIAIGEDWKKENYSAVVMADVAVQILVEGVVASDVNEEELATLSLKETPTFHVAVGKFQSSTGQTQGKQRAQFNRQAIRQMIKVFEQQKPIKYTANEEALEELLASIRTIEDLISAKNTLNKVLDDQACLTECCSDSTLSSHISTIKDGIRGIRDKKITLDLRELRQGVIECLEEAKRSDVVHFAATHIFSTPESMESWSSGYDGQRAGDPQHESYVRLQDSISNLPDCTVERALILDREFFSKNREKCLGVISYHCQQLPKAKIRILLGDPGHNDLAIINSQQVFAWIRAGNGRYISGQYVRTEDGALSFVNAWKQIWHQAEPAKDFLARELRDIHAFVFRIAAGLYLVCDERYLNVLGHAELLRLTSDKWLGGPIDGYAVMRQLQFDLSARFFNVDGSEIAISPHALPCIASWAHAKYCNNGTTIRIITSCGKVDVGIAAAGHGTVTYRYELHVTCGLACADVPIPPDIEYTNVAMIYLGTMDDPNHVPHLIIEASQLPDPQHQQRICRDLCHAAQFRQSRGANVHIVMRNGSHFSVISYKRAIDRTTESFESAAIAVLARDGMTVGKTYTFGNGNPESQIEATLNSRDSEKAVVIIQMPNLLSQIG